MISTVTTYYIPQFTQKYLSDYLSLIFWSRKLVVYSLIILFAKIYICISNMQTFFFNDKLPSIYKTVAFNGHYYHSHVYEQMFLMLCNNNRFDWLCMLLDVRSSGLFGQKMNNFNTGSFRVGLSYPWCFTWNNKGNLGVRSKEQEWKSKRKFYNAL